MTVPQPPTAGPVPASERLAAEDHGEPPDIQAPLDSSIAGEFAAAESAGNAWCAEGGTLWHSPQGGMSGGYTIGAPEAADDWPTDVSFPHQGP